MTVRKKQDRNTPSTARKRVPNRKKPAEGSEPKSHTPRDWSGKVPKKQTEAGGAGRDPFGIG